MNENDEWEYGFYDSETGTHPIWWYVFGLPHKTAESADHTGRKSVTGQVVVVRRQPGSDGWEHVTEAVSS